MLVPSLLTSLSEENSPYYLCERFYLNLRLQTSAGSDVLKNKHEHFTHEQKNRRWYEDNLLDHGAD